MRLAIVAAGFTPGEADQLRRAMGAWRKVGVIDRFHQKLVQGMLQRGYTEEFAERVFQQISGFGEYGFPESHAASFALLVYVSAWLKRYHPAAFCAALINSQPMGFYAPAQLIRDAKAHGVTVLPIDVNHSFHDCTLERAAKAEHTGVPDMASARQRSGAGQGSAKHLDSNLSLRLGLRLLHGLPEEIARRIETERTRKGPFQSIQEFARRVQVGRSTLRLLSGADAFASLKPERRDALWISLPPGETLPLLEAAGLTDEDGPVPELPEMTPQEQVVADYSAAGFSLKAHPVSFLRESLIQLKVASAEELPMLTPDRRVRVAGLILMRQRPATASGITFVTLEDETGISNLVIYPSVWQKFRQVAKFASVLLAAGRLQREGDVIHIVCDRLDDLSEMLQRLSPKSRDFR
jgi:error-prone DNA polymerase